MDPGNRGWHDQDNGDGCGVKVRFAARQCRGGDVEGGVHGDRDGHAAAGACVDLDDKNPSGHRRQNLPRDPSGVAADLQVRHHVPGR